VSLTLLKDCFSGVIDTDKVSFVSADDTGEEFLSNSNDIGEALLNSKSNTYLVSLTPVSISVSVSMAQAKLNFLV
jgi:hypothetical protein